jgi:hypothetical protein
MPRTDNEQNALDIADTMQRIERGITERDRKLAQLGAASPLRSKGQPVADVGHLPLFVAANEPTFL